MKKAMILVNNELKDKKVDAKLILQVHDELVIESNQKEVERVSQILSNCMSRAASLTVPLDVEIGKGKNWDQAH